MGKTAFTPLAWCPVHSKPSYMSSYLTGQSEFLPHRSPYLKKKKKTKQNTMLVPSPLAHRPCTLQAAFPVWVRTLLLHDLGLVTTHLCTWLPFWKNGHEIPASFNTTGSLQQGQGAPVKVQCGHEKWTFCKEKEPTAERLEKIIHWSLENELHIMSSWLYPELEDSRGPWGLDETPPKAYEALLCWGPCSRCGWYEGVKRTVPLCGKARGSFQLFGKA